MTATGSPGLWRIADRAGVVPLPPDDHLAAMLQAWWERPRVFGCVGARTSPTWSLVMPSPAILCSTCAYEAFSTEDRCVYGCGHPVRRSKAVSLLFEMHSITVFGLAHQHCQQLAAKGARP